MRRTIDINGDIIEYELTRKRVRNLNLRIRHDGTVTVSAPSRVTLSEIDSFLKEKSDFLLKALDKVNERITRAARPVTYSDEEPVNVFGERCTIVVVPSRKNKVEFLYPYVYLYVKDPDDIKVRQRTYEKWKRERIRADILEMCEYYYPKFEARGVDYPKDIKFRAMSSKWGCCRPGEGTLTFNYNLFEVPKECTAYVVVHEFAHFLEANHSQRFYREVERVMPDYKQRRKLLNEY